jgi:hypothetical protein
MNSKHVLEILAVRCAATEKMNISSSFSLLVPLLHRGMQTCDVWKWLLMSLLHLGMRSGPIKCQCSTASIGVLSSPALQQKMVRAIAASHTRLRAPESLRHQTCSKNCDNLFIPFQPANREIKKRPFLNFLFGGMKKVEKHCGWCTVYFHPVCTHDTQDEKRDEKPLFVLFFCFSSCFSSRPAVLVYPLTM